MPGTNPAAGNVPLDARVDVQPCLRAQALENVVKYIENDQICAQKELAFAQQEMSRTAQIVQNSNYPTAEDRSMFRALAESVTQDEHKLLGLKKEMNATAGTILGKESALLKEQIDAKKEKIDKVEHDVLNGHLISNAGVTKSNVRSTVDQLLHAHIAHL